MQFERFYSLNDSVVGSFPHLHHLGFQPALPKWRDDDDDNDDDPHRENFECDGAAGNEVNVDWEFLFSDHLFRRSKYELNTIEDVFTNYSMQPQ